jgi:hypothetical protein
MVHFEAAPPKVVGADPPDSHQICIRKFAACLAGRSTPLLGGMASDVGRSLGRLSAPSRGRWEQSQCRPGFSA